MTDRVLDLSAEPARLSVRMGLLVLERKDQPEVTMPFEDLAVLVVSHRRVSYTHSVLMELSRHNCIFVACDERHMPVGMMLPIEGHNLQQERFAKQAEAALPVKKRLWQQIVRAKVQAQGKLLHALHGDDLGLRAMTERVKSGDPDNVEGQAARKYWGALFGDRAFRRNRDGEDENCMLNYGYAVLRAMVSRGICAAGLHPSLGLHHHNRYDGFCLADDLMEPFRPVVDSVVAVWVATRRSEGVKTFFPLEKDAKGAILNALGGRVVLGGEERTVFDVAHQVAVSLVKVFMGEGKTLVLPEL